jgi:hypothetical protein
MKFHVILLVIPQARSRVLLQGLLQELLKFRFQDEFQFQDPEVQSPTMIG